MSLVKNNTNPINTTNTMNVPNTLLPKEKNTKTVEIWENSLLSKTASLQNAFGICLIVALMVFAAVLAFGKYELKDGLLVVLLILSVVSTFPHVEVAVPVKNSFVGKHVTMQNWRNTLQKNEKFTILSSNLHFLQPMFSMLCILSFVLFGVHKILGKSYVTYNFVLLILTLQVPFNPLFGLNPFASFLIRQRISKHVTQTNISEYLRSTRVNNASQARPESIARLRDPLTTMTSKSASPSLSREATMRPSTERVTSTAVRSENRSKPANIRSQPRT